MKKTLLVAALISLNLTACVPVVLFGGAVAGAYTASDRRTVSQQLDDKKLDSLVERRIEENFGESLHVNATVFNGVLLLTGEVPTPELRKSLNELIVVLKQENLEFGMDVARYLGDMEKND